MTRLIQLSDCHIAGDPRAPYRGQDARTNLQAVLARVRAWAPDLLLVTGDLSEDASPASYAWLRDALTCGPPVLALPGNHDEPRRLRAHFPQAPVDTPLVIDADPWRLVLLNSAVPGEISGRLGEGQRERLDAILDAQSRPVLVALHHQPLAMGSGWIDRYPLLEPERFWAVIGRHPCVRAVAWGHVHHAVDFERGGVRALSCPSTASNSLPHRERFRMDPAGPACRWFELMGDGEFRTGVMHAATHGPA